MKNNQAPSALAPAGSYLSAGLYLSKARCYHLGREMHTGGTPYWEVPHHGAARRAGKVCMS